MTVFYLFSIIGGLIFGGIINTNIIDTITNNGIPSSYIYNNFNDMGSAFITLFELMIVNNWQVITQMYVDAWGSA